MLTENNVDSNINEFVISPAGYVPFIRNEPIKAVDQDRRKLDLMDVIRSSLAISTPDEFCDWLQGDLQHVFPHGMMACSFGEIVDLGSRVQYIVTCNFPLAYLQSLTSSGGLITSPIIATWLKSRQPVLFNIPEQHENQAWLESFKKYDLRNVATHGQCDIASHTTSYFSFSQIPGNLTTQHSELLELLVPYLHATLIKIFSGPEYQIPQAKSVNFELTARELEVLTWIHSGKTHGEIAQILSVSESTIKKHAQSVYQKMGVTSKTQAVAKAVAAGLLFHTE